MKELKNNLHILMQEDSGLNSRFHPNSKNLKKSKIVAKKAHET
jgi:hypothetical protein